MKLPNNKMHLNIQFPADSNLQNWKYTVHGVFFMILSTILAASQTAIVKWGSRLGYIASVILVIRGSIQFIICFIEATVQPHLHIIRDIKSIGIVPKRTSIPIFNEITAMTSMTNLNYGAISSSKLSESAELSRCNNQFSRSRLDLTNQKTFYCLIWTSVILRGVFGGIATLFKFQAFILLPVGDVLALLALSAIFTPILAYIFFKDPITISHIVSLIGAVVGVILIVQPPFIFNDNHHKNQHPTLGFLFAILAAIIQSLIYISIQFARKVPVYILILSQSIWSVVTGFIVLLFACYSNSIGTFNNILWGNSYIDIGFILTLGLSGYFALWFLTKSAHFISSGIISLLTNLSIVWGYILQSAVFQEVPSWLTIIGAVTMFVSAVIVSSTKITDARKKSMSVIQRNITTNDANI